MDNVRLIWMQSRNGYIGKDGELPFRIPEDMQNFRKLTQGKVVIMGRKTWDSIPDNFRPLPGRYNVILTNNKDYTTIDNTHVEVIYDLEQFLLQHRKKEIWIIGGGEVYKQAMRYAKELFVTMVHADAAGDTKAPDISPDMFRCVSHTRIIHSTSMLSYQMEKWVRHRIVRYVKTPSGPSHPSGRR